MPGYSIQLPKIIIYANRRSISEAGERWLLPHALGCRNTVAHSGIQAMWKVALKQRIRGVKYGQWRTLALGKKGFTTIDARHFPDELESMVPCVDTPCELQTLINQQYVANANPHSQSILNRWGYTSKPLKRAYMSKIKKW